MPGVGSASPSATRTHAVLQTGGCATYPTAPVTSIQGTAQVGNSDIINELNNRLWPYATEHFGDVFAGTEVVTDTGVLRAYRTPSSAFDAWVMREFARDCVEIADARASTNQMQAWSDLITNDHGYWSSRGIDIITVGGNPVDGIVEVGVPQPDLEKARREVPARSIRRCRSVWS